MGSLVYDVAIVGAGVCGASIARALSSYQLRIVLLEKCVDVGFGVSKANSGIVHAGFHHKPGSLKARLELQGNLMFEKLHLELGFPFERVGILVVAFSPEEMKTVDQLYRQGRACGVPNLQVVGAERLRDLEPVLNPDAIGGLYAPTGGILEPYRFVFALVENACANGVELRTDFRVTRAEAQGKGWRLHAAAGGCIETRFAVNAAGLFADEVSQAFGAEQFTIRPRKGEEFLLDRDAAGHPRHVLFPLPSRNSKGILVIPTVEGTTMIGPTAEDVDDKHDVATTRENLQRVFDSARHMVPSVSRRDIITAFAGLRPALDTGDFYIDMSAVQPRLVQVAGIQSPGLTASPAIGEYVKDLLKSAGLTLTEKPEWNAHLDRVQVARGRSAAELEELVGCDPRYGSIVCRCEQVSEAEIVEAIRKGHTTLDGIKFYTRAGMGRCQGGFCTYRILRILARETGMSIPEITKRGGGSREVAGTLAEEVSDADGGAP